MSKELNELKELILLMKQNPAKKTVLGNGGLEKNSKLGKLYEGIAEGNYVSDTEAAADLYPGEAFGSNYRKLKFTLREKLVNSLFEIDLKSSEYNEYQRAYYDCHKNWAAVKILLGKNAANAALNLALKVFKQAEQFEFTAIALDIASNLRLHFGLKEGDYQKFQHYSRRFDYHSQLYSLESRAEQLYLDMVIPEVTSKQSRTAEIPQLEYMFKEATLLLNSGSSYRLNLYTALIQLSCLNIKKDYLTTLECCNFHIHYFQQKNYEAHVPLQILHYQKIICLFQLKQYKEGISSAEECNKYLTIGTYNWFKYKEMLLRMALCDQNYYWALELFHKVTSHPRFLLLPENVTEVWMVYKAYLYFLTLTLKLDIGGKKNIFKAFRTHKFANETLLYAKDKRGLNIAIQIIQFAILLAEGKKMEAIDLVDPLEQYSYRYLRREEYGRSRVFIKMLVQIPLSGFDANVFAKKIAPWLAKLKSMEGDRLNQHTDIEFIPYEHLWDVICNLFVVKRP